MVQILSRKSGAKRLDDWLPPVGDGSFGILSSANSADLCVISARNHVHRYPEHIHDCVELIWIHAGDARIWCRGVAYQVKAGDVCVIAPNELHSARVSGHAGCTFTLVHLPSGLYWSVLGKLPAGQVDVEPFRILRYRSLGRSINAVLGVFSATTDELARRDGLSELLETLMTSRHSFASVRAEKAFWHPAVVHARQVMSGHSAESVELEEIAAQVGLNMRYFISLFKAGTGLPPHRYQIAMRVERAREMLQRGEKSLSDVAADAGFSDQSHLSRHFKRSYGFTPGIFRQHMRPII